MGTKVTAGINLAKSKMKWSEVGAHNDRNYSDMKHDKNKNIDYRFTKYNRYGSALDYYKLMIPFVNRSKLRVKYNRCLAHRQKKRARKFSSAKSYLRSKHYRNTRCGVVFVGSSNTRSMLEHLGHKEGWTTAGLRKYEANGLQNYILNFNNHHHYVKINHYAIHSDESFIHAHVEFVGIGAKTKTGRISFNFNNSLRKEEHAPNNRIALKRFRAEEDPIIAKSVVGLGLIRTGLANGDTQAQHSYAVAESSKASYYSDMASSYDSAIHDVNVKASSANAYINSFASSTSASASRVNSSLALRESMTSATDDMVTRKVSYANSVVTDMANEKRAFDAQNVSMIKDLDKHLGIDPNNYFAEYQYRGMAVIPTSENMKRPHNERKHYYGGFGTITQLANSYAMTAVTSTEQSTVNSNLASMAESESESEFDSDSGYTPSI